MQQSRIRYFRSAGYSCCCIPVDTKRQIRLGFCLIDLRVGRTIDNPVSLKLRNKWLNCVEIRQIKLLAI
jgi:hypothetical protein